MTDLLMTACGLTAGGLCATSFSFQLVRIWRAKNAAAVSLPTYASLTAGTILWLVFSWETANVPVFASNMLTLLMTSAIAVLKIKYDRKTRHAAAIAEESIP